MAHSPGGFEGIALALADIPDRAYQLPRAGYKSLSAHAPIRLATGEALCSVFDFRRLIDARLVSVVQADLTLCGSFSVARLIGM